MMGRYGGGGGRDGRVKWRKGCNMGGCDGKGGTRRKEGVHGEVDEVEEVTDLEGIAEEEEVASSSTFVDKCPLCGRGFADVDKLSTHASNCQDTA